MQWKDVLPLASMTTAPKVKLANEKFAAGKALYI
jgi:hypothetical protein